MTIKESLSLVVGLQRRVSHPRLTDPAPPPHILAECYKAAFRSPDHAWLRPWRFIECREGERESLGNLIADAVKLEQENLSDIAEKKYRNGPLRAPLVILCIAELQQHPKVPDIEQKIAAGCAVNNLSNAIYGHGYGAVWRSGDPVYSVAVHKALKLRANQVLLGFLYVGTPMSADKEIPTLDQADYVQSLTDHLANPLFLHDNP
jgi:nitroreductase